MLYDLTYSTLVTLAVLKVLYTILFTSVLLGVAEGYKECTVFGPTNRTISSKQSVVTYVHSTYLDVYRVIFREEYTEADSYRKLCLRCGRVDLKHRIVN
jgi:hypothetical protein